MKILICEDHELFRDALRRALRALEPVPELIETAGAEEAFAAVADDPEVGLVLLDLGLPGIDGWAALARLRERHPLVGVVIVSATSEAADVRRALDAGAAGFIPKSAPRDVLVKAVQLVLAGGVYVPPLVLEAAPEPVKTRARREPSSPLTPRQLEILKLIARGLTNREIGGVLGIAEGTVKSHVERILGALDISNRTEAVWAVQELGIDLGKDGA